VLGVGLFLGQGKEDTEAQKAINPTKPSTQVAGTTGEASAVATPDQVRQRVLERIERELEEAERVGVENEAQMAQALERAVLTPKVPDEFLEPGDREEGEALLGVRAVIPSTQVPQGLPQPQTSAQYRAVGDRLASEANWQDATVAYAKAVELSPGDPLARLRLGESLFRVDRLDDAEPHLTVAVNAGVVAAHLTLARVRANQGDDAGAMDHYRQYLASNPPDRNSIEAEVQRLTEG